MRPIRCLAVLIATSCPTWAATLVADKRYQGVVAKDVLKRNESSCLAADVRQSASGLTGQEKGTEGVKDGQSPSDM